MIQKLRSYWLKVINAREKWTLNKCFKLYFETLNKYLHKRFHFKRYVQYWGQLHDLQIFINTDRNTNHHTTTIRQFPSLLDMDGFQTYARSMIVLFFIIIIR